MPKEDDYNTLNELAERLGLEDQERESFVTSSMKRLGYRPRVDWDEPENNGGDDKGSGDFFSGKRQQRQQRQVRDGSGRQQQASGGGGGWQYE